MEKVNKKVERYIQLSKQFNKTSEDIFGKEVNSNFNFTGSSVYHGVSINDISTGYTQHQESVKEKSRAEKIREQSEIKAKIAEDYDEYLQLQKELGDYFTSLNKLTQ